MAIPEAYEGIEGIGSDGYLLPDADELSIGVAIAGARMQKLATGIADLVSTFVNEHGLSAELSDGLAGLIRDGISFQAGVQKSIPVPAPKPYEGGLVLNDLTDPEKASAIHVDPRHRHYNQQGARDLLATLMEVGVVEADPRADGFFEIFKALQVASDLGYRARVIEE